MRKLFTAIAIIMAFFCHSYSTTIFNTPTQFTTGSSLTINSGVPLIGTWNWQSGSAIDFTGSTVTGLSLPVTLTGNVTGSGTGTVPTTVVTIPDLVSASGSILFTNVAGPVAPATGFIKGYANSTDKRFHDVNDAGTTGTTVVANTGGANQFLTGISTAGVVTAAQPTFSNLSGSMNMTAEPSMAANTVMANATGLSTAPTAVAPAAARSSSLLNIDEKTTPGDTNYTILATDRTVVTTTLSAPRTWTLPVANSVNPGQQLSVIDIAGAVGISSLTISRGGSDTIEPGALTSFAITQTKQGFTFVSDGISKWYITSTGLGLPSSGKILQSNGSINQYTSYTLPSNFSTQTGYMIKTDGSNVLAYPTNLVNSSTTTVSAGYAADTYVAGTTVTVKAGDWKVSGRYHFVFDMTKTAAGTATPIVTLRIGTLGTTGDTAICTATFSAGTASADSGTFEGWAVFRSVGSGTSAVVELLVKCDHEKGSNGLVSNNTDYAQVTSAGFDSTLPTKIGVSFNGGTSFSGTNVVATGDLVQP